MHATDITLPKTIDFCLFLNFLIISKQRKTSILLTRRHTLHQHCRNIQFIVITRLYDRVHVLLEEPEVYRSRFLPLM